MPLTCAVQPVPFHFTMAPFTPTAQTLLALSPQTAKRRFSVVPLAWGSQVEPFHFKITPKSLTAQALLASALHTAPREVALRQRLRQHQPPDEQTPTGCPTDSVAWARRDRIARAHRGLSLGLAGCHARRGDRRHPGGRCDIGDAPGRHRGDINGRAIGVGSLGLERLRPSEPESDNRGDDAEVAEHRRRDHQRGARALAHVLAADQRLPDAAPCATPAAFTAATSTPTTSMLVHTPCSP